MQKIALHTRLKPGKESDYEKEHRVIPPELDVLLREHGVHSWRIYRNGCDIFHFVECLDYAKLLSSIQHHPVNIAWQKKMAEFLDVVHDYGDVETNTLDLVWHLPQAQDLI